jgi:hypothetical protein
MRMREAKFRTRLDQRLWKHNTLTKKAIDKPARRNARAEIGLKGLSFGQTTLESVALQIDNTAAKAEAASAPVAVQIFGATPERENRSASSSAR